MDNIINERSIKKLKLLITIVDRSKGEFYLDVIEQFDVNTQLVLPGLGTATSEITNLLGLNQHKAVILSIAAEDVVAEVIACLEEKFRSVKKGKGVAFAIPLSSVIGVNIYQFLSNNRLGKESATE